MKIIPNPYFSMNQKPQSQPPEPKAVGEKTDFKQYPEEGKKHETISGFTSIIIPAFFNSYPVFHYCGNLIGSIREHTDKTKTPYEIILIQNGETGIGFTEKSAKDSHADKIIFNKENLGFSKAVNQGIRCANGEYIAIVNTDVMVFNHWLEDLQECLKNGVDLIQSYPAYGMPYARAVESEALRNEWKDKPIAESFDDFRDFSCVLTTKELFNKVGLFDEAFQLYCEDLDLVRRIEKAEGVVKSTKRVRTFHIIGATTTNMQDTPEVMEQSKERLKSIWGK
jgi:GT2 family glycosyltransferase